MGDSISALSLLPSQDKERSHDPFKNLSHSCPASLFAIFPFLLFFLLPHLLLHLSSVSCLLQRQKQMSFEPDNNHLFVSVSCLVFLCLLFWRSTFIFVEGILSSGVLFLISTNVESVTLFEGEKRKLSHVLWDSSHVLPHSSRDLSSFFTIFSPLIIERNSRRILQSNAFKWEKWKLLSLFYCNLHCENKQQVLWKQRKWIEKCDES